MKEREDAEDYERFEAAHGEAIWEQVLQSRRKAEGSPNWRPNFMEGMVLQNKVRKILRDQYSVAS
jgi:hypothetical protein